LDSRYHPFFDSFTVKSATADLVQAAGCFVFAKFPPEWIKLLPLYIIGFDRAASEGVHGKMGWFLLHIGVTLFFPAWT
jgi:hypothetical protein